MSIFVPNPMHYNGWIKLLCDLLCRNAYMRACLLAVGQITLNMFELLQFVVPDII